MSSISSGLWRWRSRERGKSRELTPSLLARPAEIYREEMFAPVFSLLTYKTEEEAIFIANDHDYGLAAAVWSADTNAAYRIARGINAGMVHINGATVRHFLRLVCGLWLMGARADPRLGANAARRVEAERLRTVQRHRGHPVRLFVGFPSPTSLGQAR